MVAAKQAWLALAMSAVLLSAMGCSWDTQKRTLTPAEWATTAEADLNCPGQGHAIVRPGRRPLFYDLNGDGSPEWFVDLICSGTDPARAPDQVEVFQDTSRSSRMVRLTSVAPYPDQQVFLAHGCMYFAGNKVVIIGRMRDRADLGREPTVLSARISTSTDDKIETGPAIRLRTADDLPPACT